MAILVKFVADNAAWFYGLCAVLALLFLRVAWSARRERLQAIFTLEKEAAAKRETRLLWVALAILAFLALIFSLERYVAPSIALPVEPEATPTLLFLPTPSATPALPTPTPTATATRVRPPRPTRLPTPTDTPTPAPPAPPPQCPNPAAQITAPGNGATVTGVVQFAGTANVENFQYYKLELGVGASPKEWAFLFSKETPVVNGPLGSWDSATVPSGTYTIRLVVVDVTGNYPPPCQVTLQVTR
ncbi:MAG: hypothetical protein H5T59_04885 [Anaerolineae bacterium]|nr:hypothetical protein [Anaerolineae bacterium]